MKILITGSNGFTGSHLVRYLKNKPDLNLYCTSRSKKQENDYICDLTDYNSVNDLIQEIKPVQIYHLAGSFTNNYKIDYINNVLSSKNIFDSLIQNKLSCRVLLVGSAAEYGFIKEENNPVKEDHLLNPVSIYGLTKVYQTHLMEFYHKVHELNCVMTRTFNLLGNNISNKLFIGKIYQQIEQYKKGEIQSIALGNLNSRRDYIDISEAIKYYTIVMNNGKKGEIYNVGSGLSVRLSDLLERILVNNGITINSIKIEEINSINKLNVDNIFADLSKITLLS